MNKFNLTFEPAETSEDYIELIKKVQTENNIHHDFISDLDQLGEYYTNSEINVDQDIWEAFIKEAIFDKKGLVTSRYDVLADHITFNQLEELYARMGIGSRLFSEWRDHVCHIDPGLGRKCRPKIGYTCSDINCCGKPICD